VAFALLRRNLLMKIRDIKTYRLDAALAEPFAYSQAWYDHRGALLVEIIGEDGLSGWGEAFGPPPLTAPIVRGRGARMTSKFKEIVGGSKWALLQWPLSDKTPFHSLKPDQRRECFRFRL
jgi:hypothetical protein